MRLQRECDSSGSRGSGGGSISVDSSVGISQRLLLKLGVGAGASVDVLGPHLALPRHCRFEWLDRFAVSCIVRANRIRIECLRGRVAGAGARQVGEGRRPGGRRRVWQHAAGSSLYNFALVSWWLTPHGSAFVKRMCRHASALSLLTGQFFGGCWWVGSTAVVLYFTLSENMLAPLMRICCRD